MDNTTYCIDFVISWNCLGIEYLYPVKFHRDRIKCFQEEEEDMKVYDERIHTLLTTQRSIRASETKMHTESNCNKMGSCNINTPQWQQGPDNLKLDFMTCQ